MNRIDRLTSIILMLQNHRVVTAEKIAGHFEISMRTVYRDIAALGEAGVPIMAEAGVGYSLMRGYNVPPIMFSESEVAALFMSAELTEKMGDHSFKKSLESALMKVKAALPDGHKTYISKLVSSLEIWTRPSGFQENTSLMPIQEAVVKRHCITLKYLAGRSGELTDRTVEPLGLIFYSRKWHLIAWCRLREAIRDFRLDRIQKWQILSEKFSGHLDFSLSKFIEEIIKEEAKLNIEFECSHWVLDRILHDVPAQNVKKELISEGRYLIQAEAYSLEWLARWLVGFTTSVEVKKPPLLKELLLNEIEKISQLYR